MTPSTGSEPEGADPHANKPAADRGGHQPDDGTWQPMQPLPDTGFWEVLYGRRSIRKFTEQPVSRDLIDQVLHAGIWAPSSCNYQMWDLVAVDDADRNAKLAALSAQMGNAPVNIIVAYGRDFSEENFANIQSASALIQNMSLAAEALGLGTFWITQTGDAEKVRDMVGLPRDRMVVAVLALGYAKIRPKRGPKRRPLTQVTHYNHYAGRPIPSSIDPEVWEPDLLAIYQRARVLNGLRHNKPKAWERRALETALQALLPPNEKSSSDADSNSDTKGDTTRAVVGVDAPAPRPARWLDVLPCTGILTEFLSQKRRGYSMDVVERTPEVARWCADRTFPKGRAFAWPTGVSEDPDAPGENETQDAFHAPPQEHFDVITCLFRLEGLRAVDRKALWNDMTAWLKPGGQLLVGFVSSRSFHGQTERMRAKRGGPGGVEYVLSPDPNVGPFSAMLPEAVQAEGKAAGLQLVESLGLQAAPPKDELEFRTRNFQGWKGGALRASAKTAGWIYRNANAKRGRYQFRLFQKPVNQ